MQAAHQQRHYAVRHDWGLVGASAITTGVDVAVVVDVLSFTTTLSVAADLGITVLPYRWADQTAADFAAEHDAALAVGRSTAGPGQISLSPTTVRAADPAPARLVLPPPNGSTIAHHLAKTAPVVVGACLRNAAAVAAWITDQHPAAATRLAVVSAGERWPDGSLRPSVEDLWGAGAVIAALAQRGWTDMSPEAEVARDAHRSIDGDPNGALVRCASGRELIAVGYPDDVEVAAEADTSDAVPVMMNAGFVWVRPS